MQQVKRRSNCDWQINASWGRRDVSVTREAAFAHRRALWSQGCSSQPSPPESHGEGTAAVLPHADGA